MFELGGSLAEKFSYSMNAAVSSSVKSVFGAQNFANRAQNDSKLL